MSDDVVKKIDSKVVTMGNFEDEVHGCDLPGSELVLTIQRKDLKGTNPDLFVQAKLLFQRKKNRSVFLSLGKIKFTQAHSGVGQRC